MKNGKRQLLLINPANPYRKGYRLRRESKQPPLGLGIVASLTPGDWSIRIVDENFREHRFREADLVGITAMTATAGRAYEIAAEYRSRGIPVVLGGIHGSAMPEEAGRFVDSVVIGEAEGAWPALLEDFNRGQLKKEYRSGLTDISHALPARHDLFHPGYLFAAVQTSRGCPMDCEFCSVPSFNGHRYRLRDPERVIDEIASLTHRMIYFVDDNIIGYNRAAEEHAAGIFEGMIRRNLKKEWFAQASLNIAEKPELLKLAARSGCRMLLIGIEAENEAALTDSNKKVNLRLGVDSYAKAYRMIHRAGINVLGAFIYGMESDTPEALRRRTRYILSSSVDVIQASVMTPLPGTRLFEKMKNEGRLLIDRFPEGWQHFHFSDVVFRPGNMTSEELARETDAAYQEICRMGTLRKRFLRTLWNTRSLRSAVWGWNSNLNYRAVGLEKATECRYGEPACPASQPAADKPAGRP